MPSSLRRPTACLALADGSVFWGQGFGAVATASGQLIYDTAMSGYQEILSNPANSGRVVLFTFPHVGNTGTVAADDEGSPLAGAVGLVVRTMPTQPSNWRADHDLTDWLTRIGRVGIANVDTRRLTRLLRTIGSVGVAVAHDPAGAFDPTALVVLARGGVDVLATGDAPPVQRWDQGSWDWPRGFGAAPAGGPRVVVIDQGSGREVLRQLVAAGCEVIVVPATATLAEVQAQQPAGILLSDGPGNAAGDDGPALARLHEILALDLPVLGLGSGHRQIATALGARVTAAGNPHHGANHPVRNLSTGRVEIARLHHAATIDADSLPPTAIATHISLFNGGNCGLRLRDRPVFGQYHHPASATDITTAMFGQFLAVLPRALPA